MAQNPDATLRFFFGVELELVLTRKQNAGGSRWKDWDEAAETLSQLLKAKPYNIPNVKVPPKSTDYKLWNVAMDGTIGRADPELQRWGVELISSASLDTGRSDWVKAQKKLWQCVDSNYTVRPSNTCGTHVHISLPSLRAFTAQRMKRVCKAVVYFERCIDSIMPPHRRNNRYCKSNRYNEILREYQTMPEVFKAIDSTKTHTELADLVAPDRFVRWNFQRMATTVTEAKVATVEFRQPPGCTTVDEAFFWQGFALAFLGAAITSQASIDPKRVPGMADLAQFVAKGKFMHRAVYTGGFDDFINGKQKLREGEMPDAPQPVAGAQDRNADLQEDKLEEAFAANP